MSVTPLLYTAYLEAMYSSFCGLLITVSVNSLLFCPQWLLYHGPLYIPPLSPLHVHCFHYSSHNSMDKTKLLKIGGEKIVSEDVDTDTILIL